MGELVGMVWGDWLVLLLVVAGLWLTIANGFPQFRGFKHAIYVVRGHYDDPKEQGEITHFQALTAALSATVGLGNIAGVAVAVTSGGPGAVFWMWVCGFLGMATKYTECTLSTATRDVRADGTVAGGPMYYMRKHLPRALKPIALVYAVFITISSFGGGNMFQANQAAALWETSFGVPTWVTGLILVVLVGLVIVGGIKRIGRVTDKLVPTMVFLYVGGALAVIFVHIDLVPGVFGSIFSEAWSVSAAVGGTLGVVLKDVLKQGFRRAAFSNEAGFGSAAIAHAAVKTDEPIREGVVALLEPFVDTIVICTMTALVILISGVWTQQGLDGAPLTAAAFDSAFDGFGSILVPVAVFLFAISTMISWSYYGEKGVEFFLGRRAVMPYRLLFVGLVFIGAVWKLGPVLDFSDAMFGLVAVPNLIALFILTPRIRALTSDYFGRLKSGQMVKFK
ncbi:MAG: alanine:cation symporter family protein [Deltaproteobacteria bacterium]|nr:MAG: alanine:cation symporter family protein [Deltaproteobacteria bacterium]